MDRYNSIKSAGIFGIIGNIILLIIKASIGVITNSQAMIADAANSGGDIFASLMTFIGSKIASKPDDEDHNIGHGKAEYIFSLFISISMIAVAMELLYNSVKSLIFGASFTFSWMLIIVCIITISIKLCLYLYTNHISKKYKSLLLDANKKDHRNDCIATTFTLISSILDMYGIYWFDSMVGIGISIWICITGIKIFSESYNVLMDTALDEKSKSEVLNALWNYPQIQKYNHFSSSPVGYKYLISITIFVDGNMSTFDSHEIADNLEKDLNKLDFIYRAIIHVNPI